MTVQTICQLKANLVYLRGVSLQLRLAMFIKGKNLFLPIGCLVLSAVHSFASGQEGQVVAEAEPESDNRRSRLYFIDTPKEIESEFNDQIDWPIVKAEPMSEDDPQFIQRMGTIRRYSESIRAIEADGGAWDRGLLEELATLGELQQRQGDHVSAIETFDRAIHISRINNGLHTLDQIPALEQKIESYLAMGDWEQADLYYNYMFYVQQKIYGSSDPRLIPMIGRLANWNLRAFNIGFGESLGLRLSSAMLLFDAAARMVEVHFGQSDERFTDFQQSIANVAYLVSRHPDLMNEMNRPEYRLNQDALRRKLVNSDRVMARGFQSGELALLNIINQERSKGVYSIPLAEASANLGDWYLMFERRKAANAMYAEAWNIVAQLSPSEELLDQIFGHVIPLPTFLDSPTSLVFASGEAKDTKDLQVGFVDVVFDVTENGVVRNLEIVSEQTDENAMILSRLRREVRNSAFRPVIEDGMPVRTSGNQFRYRYWY